MIIGRDFSVTYVKSQDPNKCHQPSVDQLRSEYGMEDYESDAFNKENPQFLDTVRIVPEGYYYDEEKGQCLPIVSNTPTATPTATATPTGGVPTNTPMPTATPNPEHTPTPVVEPTATPVVSPTTSPTGTVPPTNTPTPLVTQQPGPGKQSSLSYDVSCDKDEVKANMLLTDNGQAVSDVEVRFDYNGTKKEAMTGSNGRAVVMFTKDGENWLMAEADGFESRRYQVKLPECPAAPEAGVGGAVLGASTQGQVLGASTDPSTFADTGLVTDFAAIMAGIFGVVALAKSRVIG